MDLHVIYVQPRVLSAGPQMCWEPIAGTPAIQRLADSLQSAGTVFILCHGEPPCPINAAQVMLVDAPNRFEALTVFARAHLNSTMFVYHQDTLFPDCGRAARMLAFHQGQSADATFAGDYPPGMLPEIYESSSLLRLSGVPVDQVWDLDRVMEQRGFRVARFKRDHRAEPELERLPASLLVQGGAARRAAERALCAGIDFPQALRQVEYPMAAPRTDGKPRVLFCTLADILGGAEESLFLLAANLTRYTPLVLLPTRSLLAEKMEAARVEVLYPGFDYGRFNPAALAYFERLIATAKLDLVHIDSFQVPPLMMAARAAAVPVVQHVRVLHSRRAPELFKFADRVIAVSDSARLDLLRSGLDPDRVIRIFNGVDLQAFSPLPDRAAPGENFVLSMVARLTEIKGQHFVLEAMPALVERIPNLRILLAGESYPPEQAYRDRLERILARTGLGSRVTFAGFEPQPRRVYAASDAVVLATDGEAFARCVLEALAMGVPVIAPDRHGPAEIITHGVNGLLYRPHSQEDFVDKVAALADDAGLRSRLCANGPLRAGDFRIADHVLQVEALYDRLLAGTLD